MQGNLHVQQAAVLGAGVMGSQIAAHLVNCGVPVTLFELPGNGADRRGPARDAIERLRKMKPTPLVTPDRAAHLTPADYDDDLERLTSCDLVIEAVAERQDIKHALYERVASALPSHVALGSNTSGLAIAGLARALPDALRRRFCGVHFFNPPRYMHLLELTPHADTDPELLDALEAFCTQTLGKGVVRTRDTPNFIANRLGVFSMAATMHHAERLGLPPDVVDALTGPAIGRPKSATFRTADLVGLDTLRHVVEGSAQLLGADPWQGYLKLPGWINDLIEQGALGEKRGAGVFRKVEGAIHVFDPQLGTYREAQYEVARELQSALRIREPAERFGALAGLDHPQAAFLWAIHRDLFHYAAYWLGEIAHSAREVDLALRWGFGWHQGPFETWQAAGWQTLARQLQDAIRSGETLCDAALPEWVQRVDGVHSPEGSYDPAADLFRPRAPLPVYRRQRVPQRVLGEPRPKGETTYETAAVRLWHLDDDVGILSFRTAACAVSTEVLDGVIAAVAEAEARYSALVVWQDADRFSVGADLKQVGERLKRGDFASLQRMVERFQQATGVLRSCRIPTVAAIRGMALGGGCEFQMHADHVVAATESSVGLVEAGVGLIPAGGGCKELARRAAADSPDGDLTAYLQRAFDAIAMAKVATSAQEAKQLGLLRPADTVVPHADEILHVAHAHARALAESRYRPPLEAPLPVAGRDGSARLESQLTNYSADGSISHHDHDVARAAAVALCGGEVDIGTVVPPEWLLALEVEHFMALLRTDKTRARIEHMMETGKRLRN